MVLPTAGGFEGGEEIGERAAFGVHPVFHPGVEVAEDHGRIEDRVRAEVVDVRHAVAVAVNEYRVDMHRASAGGQRFAEREAEPGDHRDGRTESAAGRGGFVDIRLRRGRGGDHIDPRQGAGTGIADQEFDAAVQVDIDQAAGHHWLVGGRSGEGKVGHGGEIGAGQQEGAAPATGAGEEVDHRVAVPVVQSAERGTEAGGRDAAGQRCERGPVGTGEDLDPSESAGKARRADREIGQAVGVAVGQGGQRRAEFDAGKIRGDAAEQRAIGPGQDQHRAAVRGGSGRTGEEVFLAVAVLVAGIGQRRAEARTRSG